ncbi:protein yippee-like 5 [Oncorhynchus tshawytscha]|uniref:Yippee domain-containing protein n=1 Tax=Oncorhynchus kisutch TaxID=8019 RepID=A0A8C7INA4_ONCKI|nr:protein yippee-like 5 [Oncorhynchus tshawytscha]
MGRIFLDHIGGTCLFSCTTCDTILTNRSELISTSFTGTTGRAFHFTMMSPVIVYYSYYRSLLNLKTGRVKAVKTNMR